MGGLRGDFQNSKYSTANRGFIGAGRSRRLDEDKLVKNFIWAHTKWVEKRVLEQLNVGDAKAVQEALEQIHAKSLLEGNGGKKQTYNDVLTGATGGKISEKQEYSSQSKGEDEWQQVTHKRRSGPKRDKIPSDVFTIFLHNIPDLATGKQVWELFQNCGKILDIILPKKRDAKGKRYGFVHTSSELEAGAIISNAKQDKRLGSKIRMSINGVKKPDRQSKVEEPKEENRSQGNLNNNKMGENKEERFDFGKKMFEFIELEIDEEVERALLKCKIGYTWFDESAENLQDKLNDTGLGKYKVTALSTRKFLIRKDDQDNWEDLNKSDLSDDMGVLFKGEQKRIRFKEVTDTGYLVGKVLPMDFSEKQEPEGSFNNAKCQVSEGSNVEEVLNPEEGAEQNKEQAIRPPLVKTSKEAYIRTLEESGSQLDAPCTELQVVNNFRADYTSSEVNSEHSKQEELERQSELYDMEQNMSLQTDLCTDVAKKLRVKSSRGRPRKVNNVVRNPFEIGIKFKNKKKKNGGRKTQMKAKERQEASQCLQIIPVGVVGKSVHEALEIVRSAESMGLVIKGDRDLAIQEIARKLDDGEL
ncbi:hypothetical protein ACET3Z_000828 [Daucus carota]